MTRRLVTAATALAKAKPSTAALVGAVRTVAMLARTQRGELADAVRHVPPTALLAKVPKGAALGIAALTALPVFGPVGVLTAVGVAVGATIGAAAGVAEEVLAARRRSAIEGESDR